MPDAYTQLLDATIQQLEAMKSAGARHVNVDRATLAALAAPLQRTSAPPPAISQTAPAIIPPPKQPAATVPATGIQPAPAAKTEISPTTNAPSLSAAEKVSALAALRERALVCTRCPHLVSSRTQVVFGVGSANAELMFVGEAPGADEDRQGEPFVGAAGQMLTKIIQTMGLSRDTVYIANILKCRPDMPAGSSGNRKPTPEEMQTCIPWLLEQIEIIRPRAMVALGATAVEGLLGKAGGITRLRGNWQSFRGTPLMPTFHPAYLLRNQALAEKRKVWEDMLAVMTKLDMPISEKQRNYFLPR
ncbi:MAG: uracil-DNA glycosylase [Verrucomicrobia bacterium]|nr:uracil-DNA glycosylase [Verrucomicrobiota bacterium]